MSNGSKSFRVSGKYSDIDADKVLAIMGVPQLTRNEILALAGGILGLSVVVSISARQAAGAPSPAPAPAPGGLVSRWNVNAERRGAYTPMYTAEMGDVAVNLSSQLAQYPNNFTFNPNSGYQPISQRPDLVPRLKTIRSNSPTTIILAYIPTGYANTQSSSDPFYTGPKTVETRMTHVRGYTDDWGQYIDGFMFDEYRSDALGLPYYRDLSSQARNYFSSRTGKYCVIRGNQGAPFSDERHLSENLVDIASINENNFIPSTDANGRAEMERRTFNGKYPPHRFNWLTHSRASNTWLDAQFNLILEFVGTAYITHRSFGSNPWAGESDSQARQVSLIRSFA